MPAFGLSVEIAKNLFIDATADCPETGSAGRRVVSLLSPVRPETRRHLPFAAEILSHGVNKGRYWSVGRTVLSRTGFIVPHCSNLDAGASRWHLARAGMIDAWLIPPRVNADK
jgi:hypothetical protein